MDEEPEIQALICKFKGVQEILAKVVTSLAERLAYIASPPSTKGVEKPGGVPSTSKTPLGSELIILMTQFEDIASELEDLRIRLGV